MSQQRAETFVSLKALGDLVIARSALNRADLSRPDSPSLLIGSYLRELFEALGPYPGRCWVLPCPQVPALFDIKKQGVIAAIRSAFRLRSDIAGLSGVDGRCLVFDCQGKRQRFIAGHRPTSALPQADNIYAAYEQHFSLNGWQTLSAPTRGYEGAGQTVGIFPSSRIMTKNIPVDIVRACVASSLASGMKPSIRLLQGERPDLERAGLDHVVTVLPRGFETLVEAIRSCDVVISGDSLPAHLGEFFQRPVFVVTPLDNRYWLPRKAFAGGHWALFDEMARSSESLNKFLLRPPRCI